MQRGERHLRRRDQVQVAVARARLEQVALELGELARAQHGVRRDEVGRDDFGVAALARVQVEHEVDERALHPRAGAGLHGEARARDPGRALEVDDPELRAQLEVRPRLEVEARRLPHAAHLDVGGRVAPSRHGSVGDVGDDEERLADCLLYFGQATLERLDLIRDAFHLRLELSRVLARTAAARDLLAAHFLAVAELLDLLEERPPLGVEGPGIAAREVERTPPLGEHLLDRGAILDDPSEVEHI